MRQKVYIYTFLFLTTLYLGLAFFLPADPAALEKYKISQLQLRLLGLSIIVPFMVVWGCALYGFLRFKAYALLVKDSKEGKSFNYLADGLMVLAFGFPISGICSSLLNYAAQRSADLTPMATIWRNYITLAVSLIAFLLIAKGAEGLVRTLRSRTALDYPKYSMITIIALSSLFSWLIVSRPVSGESAQAVYYLPDWLVVTTLAIPYLFIWFVGAIAAYRLYLYKDKIKARIYARAYGELAMGIGVIVGLSILLQFLGTLAERLNRLNLTPILLIVYVLVLLYAVGYGLVARGAKKLKKIEEV